MSIFTYFCLSSSSVSLSYFNLAVRCLAAHLCMRSTFFIAVLNGTCFFRSVKTDLFRKRSAVQLNVTIYILIIVMLLGSRLKDQLIAGLVTVILLGLGYIIHRNHRMQTYHTGLITVSPTHHPPQPPNVDRPHWPNHGQSHTSFTATTRCRPSTLASSRSVLHIHRNHHMQTYYTGLITVSPTHHPPQSPDADLPHWPHHHTSSTATTRCRPITLTSSRSVPHMIHRTHHM